MADWNRDPVAVVLDIHLLLGKNTSTPQAKLDGITVAQLITHILQSPLEIPGSLEVADDVLIGTGPLADSVTYLQVSKAGTVKVIFESTDGGAVQIRLRTDSATNRGISWENNSGTLKGFMILGDDGAIKWEGETSGDEIMDVDSAGKLTVEQGFGLTEQTAEPPDPSEGEGITWQSDGTGFGDSGDICAKSTDGGTTRKNIIHDHSAGSL